VSSLLRVGIAEGIDRVQWRTHIIAAETEGANCFAAAVAAGSIVPVAITSIAKTLGASRVAAKGFFFLFCFD
jgi:threonine dehydratase